MRYLALLLLSFPAFASDSFYTGEELQWTLAVCVSKESAVAVANADSKSGIEAAGVVFGAAEDCASLPVFGAQVGKVVHTAKVKRKDKPATVSVVEIVVEGKVVAYFLTSLPVTAKLVVEPRNS